MKLVREEKDGWADTPKNFLCPSLYLEADVRRTLE